MRPGRRHSWFVILLIAAAAVLQFCLLLGRAHVTGSHEGRVVETAREMLATGDWIVPRLNDEPRLKKPPLAYWAAAGMWELAHGGREHPAWLARLPAAVCGALATLLVMDLGRRWFRSPRAGLLCALVWISTHFVVSEYRKALADPYLAFFVLLAVWAWVAGDRTRRGATLPTMISWAAMGFGALAKGPVVFAHVALAVVPYHVLRRRAPRGLGTHAGGVVLLLLIALPWPMLVLRQLPGAIDVWTRESVGRIEGDVDADEAAAWWFYPANLPLITAPWTVVVVIGLVATAVGRMRRDRRLRWPAAWFLLGVGLFSLIPSKKNAYLLPLMPAATLLVAGTIDAMLRQITGRVRFGGSGARAILIAHAVAAVPALAVVLILTCLAKPAPDYYPIAIAGVVAAVFSVYALARRRALIGAALVCAAFAVAIWLMVGAVGPQRVNHKSPAIVAAAVKDVVGARPLASLGTLREHELFYLGRTVPSFDALARVPADFDGYLLTHTDLTDARLAPVETVRDLRPDDRLRLFRARPTTAAAAEP